MIKTSPSPWDETPPTRERVVSAIARIASVLRASRWQFAAVHGLNPAQADILEALAGRSDGVRLAWIAQQMGVTAASASDSIASMEGKGLVEKTRAVDDGRAIAVRLTKTGTELSRNMMESQVFANEAVGQLSIHKQDALFAGLLEVIGTLQRAERFPALRTCVTCMHFGANVHKKSEAPHHCRLVGAPLPKAMLRLNCHEHGPADEAVATANWKRVSTG